MARSKEQRKRERRARQFGSDGKRKWIMSLPDAITGRAGSQRDPIDPAHIGRTRGAGAGPERMLPLSRLSTHCDYDVLPAAKFAAKWGITKEGLEELADEYHQRWLQHEHGLSD